MTEPQRWTDVMGIADDLAQFGRRVEDKLDDMERMQLDNLVLRLDTFVGQLPRALGVEPTDPPLPPPPTAVVAPAPAGPAPGAGGRPARDRDYTPPH